MNAADTLSKMTDLITQSRLCATLLDENLQLELEYLKSNNAKELIQLSQKKESLMHELHALDQLRKKITAENNISTKDEYLDWLMKLDPSSNLKEQWLDFSKEILKCQQQNAQNGIISESMNTASREALNILSGNTIPAVSTYCASGKKIDNSTSLHSTTA
jgi:flagellar biosynthesis/type III secretory pathway chaperone